MEDRRVDILAQRLKATKRLLKATPRLSERSRQAQREWASAVAAEVAEGHAAGTLTPCCPETRLTFCVASSLSF